MRIAFDHQTFVFQSYGGISRLFVRLAQELTNLDQQVHVFAPLHRNSYLLDLSADLVSGRHINRYPPKTTRLFLAYNQLQSRRQISDWNPDLVHETYYSRFHSAPKKHPVVITVYDMIHELFPSEFLVHDSTVVIKRIAIERADHIICISEKTKLDLIRLYDISVDKISVVHLGFDSFVSDSIVKENIPVFAKPYLLYVGNRGGYKNFNGFLKAVATSQKLMTDFNLVAFGGGKFTSAENSLINSLGFSEKQVNQVNGDDELLGSYYKYANAFVYPSLYEGFGIPPLEAMAHNCPVISSNTSSMPEVIGDAAEYCNPTEIDDIRRAIEAVVYSEERAGLLRKFGFERLNKFSWSKCAKDTLKVYGALV